MDLPYKALEILRNDGLITLLDTSRSYLRGRTRDLRGRTRDYFDEVITRRTLWGHSQFRTYTHWRHRIHRRRFVAPAEPFRTIVVNPQEIEAYNSEIEKEWGLGRILGGNWDQEEFRKPLTRHWVVTGLKQRFMDGLEWEETDYYKRAQRELQSGGSWWGYADLDQFLEVRCGYVDDLYESIEQHGYRANRTSEHRVPEEDAHRHDTAYIHQLEPMVVIGREGTMYWRDGFHRITIAKILGMRELPVQVLCRHRNWQSIRDALAVTAREQRCDQLDKTSLGRHPDLQDVL